MNEVDRTFEHSLKFEVGEITGNVRLGKLEAMYEELFAEIIEDGVITVEERAKLDKMADNLGLDRARLQRLEAALQAAYEARNRVVIRDLSADEPLASTRAPIEPATDERTIALERRVQFLERRVVELERELEAARAHINVEVDLSDVAPSATRIPVEDDPEELVRRVRHDPRDERSLHALFRHHARAGDHDARWCVAQVLSFLDVASAEETEYHAKHRPAALIRPTGSVAQDAWRKLLFHPEEEPLVGEIYGAVVSAVLIGRVSALRRDKALVRLDPALRQDPATSTIQAVRCFHWAAAILGMPCPPVYADTTQPGVVEVVPAVPPASRLGALALSGRSATELAFIAGRHLANYREEHFVRLLVPSTRGLEDVFLAALSIGNPGLPMSAQRKELIVPLANAIEPILEPAVVDRLRGHFLRFVEEGGRTNLERWTSAVERTCARAGMLLANDLQAARTAFGLEGRATDDAMDDLMSFVLSERYTRLRRQIGVAVTEP